MTHQPTEADNHSDRFCVVSNPDTLARDLGVPEDLRIGRWHPKGEESGERWLGWRMCVVSATRGSPEDVAIEYWVVQQAARPQDVNLYIQQVPGWPAHPEHLMLEAREAIDGETAGHYWDEARALFGLVTEARQAASEVRRVNWA